MKRHVSTVTARSVAASLVVVAAVCWTDTSSRWTAAAQRRDSVDPKMNFFVSSVGTGRGGDLGGVAGADKHWRLWTAGGDATCRGWTSADAGRAVVGHQDRVGGPTTWNSAHLSSGCSLPAMRRGGGDGLIYCFATD